MDYNVVDWKLIAGCSVAVTAAVQLLKNKRPFNKLDGEVLAASVGIVIALYFCLVTPGGEATWQDWVRCGVSGLVAGIAASGAYNLQKASIIPTMFPSRSEQASKEHPPTDESTK